MAKYFKNVTSFEDLKGQYKKLLKKNHPDNGGNVSAMQEINVEYDALFKIWKSKQETKTGEKVNETADSTRKQFYTEFGWKGKNHDWNRSLKEIAVIVRTYIKEKYPTYKFSVRTSYGSMCQELHVSLKEAPANIYKTFEDLTREERFKVWRIAERNNWIKEFGCLDDEHMEILKDAYNSHKFLKVYDEITAAMLNDVNSFVKLYNYEDCDGMIDYFHVDFYYFDCQVDEIKIVPKTARIKDNGSKQVRKTQNTTLKKQASKCIIKKEGYTFKVTEDTDSRDHSNLWVVRIEESLSKEEYIMVNKSIGKIGGYYSKYKHGFIFRTDPSEKLKEIS